MFEGCTSLTVLDISNFNLKSLLFSICQMFSGCESLREVYINSSIQLDIADALKNAGLDVSKIRLIVK